MRKLLICGLIVGAGVCNAQTTYNNQYGQQQGTANTYGNTTYYNDRYGRQQGSSQTYGNSTYYYDRYGLPQGSAHSYDNPVNGKTQPTSPTFDPYLQVK